MAEIRITFQKHWDIGRRLAAISDRKKELLRCKITSMKLEKEVSQAGSVVTIEETEWQGLATQELMLKTSTSFLIEYEH